MPYNAPDSGKRLLPRIGGDMRTRQPHPSLLHGGAQDQNLGIQELLSTVMDDYDNSSWEPVVAVGLASTGDSCYVPVLVEGVPCSALVDTGSTVTVVRLDVLPEGTELEPTLVRLCTVTGELAPMKGRGVLSVTVGVRTLHHPTWIAAVQDPCILGLDFLRAAGCQLDLLHGMVRFQEGPVTTLFPQVFPDGNPDPSAAKAVEAVVAHPFPSNLPLEPLPHSTEVSVSHSSDLSATPQPLSPQVEEDRLR